ncbi:MAG: acyl carrier protein [Armatimonadetes bacterium]|nr:acyl carrier protein [Armatimonadota bacterium]
MPDDLRSQLKNMIVERLFLNVSPDEIDDDENLMDEYNIDSVNLFEIIVGLEDEFGIQLEEEDLNVETFSTVSNIAGFVESKRGK